MSEQELQSECKLFPNCGSGRAQQGTDALMEHILQAYGEQSQELRNIQSNQRDQIETQKATKLLLEKNREEEKAIALLAQSFTGIQKHFDEMVSRSEKSYDLLFAEIRVLHKEKVGLRDLRIYSAIVITVSSGMFALLKWGPLLFQ